MLSGYHLTNKKKFLFLIPFILGLLLCISLHLTITFIDAKDISWANQASLLEVLKEHPQYEKFQKQILDRPLYLGVDSYYWVLYATEMVKDGKWRVRHNRYDNVPYGRDVSWNSGYSWFLVGLGKINSFFNGEQLVDSIERSAGFSNPLIVGFFVLVWAFILRKKFNPYIGCIFPFLILFLLALHSDARYGAVDHHALHNMLFLSQLISIIIGGGGFVKKPSLRESVITDPTSSFSPTNLNSAKRWFVLGGFFGALGLWVGATQQSLLIALVGVAGGATLLLFGRLNDNKDREILMAPQLWRWWGYSGAIFSLIFFLLEYFPGHMTMHLEVNHPFYALAWAGGAEAVYRIGRLQKFKLSLKEKKSHFFFLILSLIGVAVLPMSIVFGPPSWHTIHDLIIRRAHDNILEFRPFFNSNSSLLFVSLTMIVSFGLLPITLVLALALLLKKHTSIYHKVLLIHAIIPALATLGLFLLQNRWSGLLAVSLVSLTLVTTSAVLNYFPRKQIVSFTASLALIFLLMPGNILYFRDNYQGTRSERVVARLNTLIYSLLARELAVNLFVGTSGKEVRFISSDNTLTPMLAYFGVGRGVGSLYWPNRVGISDYARFFGGLNTQNALKVVKERGITHVIFKNSTETATNTAWILHGTKEPDVLYNTLAYRLLQGANLRPIWLKPFSMLYTPMLRPTGTVVYKVALDR